MITATSAQDYIATLPAIRQVAMQQLRDVVRKNLPKGFSEVVNGGFISFVVPHSRYPAGYHCDPKQPLPFVSIASQKKILLHCTTWVFTACPNCLIGLLMNTRSILKQSLTWAKAASDLKSPNKFPMN